MLYAMQNIRLDISGNETLKIIIMACSSCGQKKVAPKIVVKNNIKPIIRSVRPSSIKVVRN